MRCLREACDKDEWEQVQAALEPPNVIDPVSGVPHWYGSDDDAWAAFEAAERAARK